MRLNVPYLPEETYTNWLSRLGQRLYAVYFSLNDPDLGDARVRLRPPNLNLLIDGLQRLTACRKYLLANGRFQSAGRYLAGDGLVGIIQQFERLYSSNVLDGIIFSDPYLLKALSDTAPDLVSRLEAIPSINFMIDSPPKLEAVLTMIADTRFLPPDKITLDRSLNRRPQHLRSVAAHIRKQYPKIKIELLANEGCLNHCPFRATHEALISAVNAGMDADTFRLNRDLGCMRRLSQAPHQILTSPFIRPEDLRSYSDAADIIKICGRTLGPDFLTRIIAAYNEESYSGNLLDLLDAAHWMAEKWHLSNKELPADFSNQLNNCDQLCSTCPTCRDFFKRHARPLPIGFKRFR